MIATLSETYSASYRNVSHKCFDTTQEPLDAYHFLDHIHDLLFDKV